MLDSSPVRVSSGAFGLQPSVAFDGTRFLVTWMDGALRIQAARVSAADGAVLDSTPINLNRPPPGRSGVVGARSSVTFDGTNFLVTWGGGSGYYSPTQYNGIIGIHVRPDGTVVESSVFEIVHMSVTPNEGIAYRPQAFSTDGIALVAWPQDGTLKAARLSGSTGQLLDTTPISLGATGDNYHPPSLAARDGEFLVVWTTSNGDVWSRRLRASDGAKLGTADTLLGPGALAVPAAAFDGTDYRIIWPANRGGATQLVATRLLSSGAVDTERVLSTLPTYSGSVEQKQVYLAPSGPGSFLVTYLPYSPAWSFHIAAKTVSGDFSPEPLACASEAPSLTLNGAAELTLECGSGAYSDPGAQAFDGCGNPIAVHAYNSGQDSSGPGPNASLEGTYSVSYAAWDADGRTVSANRTVIVDDRTAPTLTLNGAAHMTHTCGSQWVDPGVVATDACYGNLTPQVWHSGEVNGWAAGTYTVTYTVTDSGGNSATPVTRTVDVVNCPW